jgi:hypothetical protein
MRATQPILLLHFSNIQCEGMIVERAGKALALAVKNNHRGTLNLPVPGGSTIRKWMSSSSGT